MYICVIFSNEISSQGKACYILLQFVISCCYHNNRLIMTSTLYANFLNICIYTYNLMLLYVKFILKTIDVSMWFHACNKNLISLFGIYL